MIAALSQGCEIHPIFRGPRRTAPPCSSMKGDVKRKSFSSEPDQAQLVWHPAFTIGKRGLSRSAVAVLMLFCIVLLTGGVLSPMLEVEVRITHLNATLLGTPIEFREQSLYFRSKNVLEVFQTLIEMGRPEMSIVAVLVLLFSVVFPVLKM